MGGPGSGRRPSYGKIKASKSFNFDFGHVHSSKTGVVTKKWKDMTVWEKRIFKPVSGGSGGKRVLKGKY